MVCKYNSDVICDYAKLVIMQNWCDIINMKWGWRVERGCPYTYMIKQTQPNDLIDCQVGIVTVSSVKQQPVDLRQSYD